MISIFSNKGWVDYPSFGSNEISEKKSLTSGDTITLSVPVFFVSDTQYPLEYCVRVSVFKLVAYKLEFAGMVITYQNQALKITYNGATYIHEAVDTNNSEITITVAPLYNNYARVKINMTDFFTRLPNIVKHPTTTMMDIKLTALETIDDCKLVYYTSLNDIAVFGNFTKACTRVNAATHDIFIGAEKAASTEILQAFKAYVDMWKPKAAIWQAGFYESDSGNNVNVQWKNNLDEFLSICRNRNIYPIVCTMPNAGNHNHNPKNQYIRALEDVFVDDVALYINREYSGNYWPMKSWSPEDDAPTNHGYWHLACAIGRGPNPRN